MTIIEDAYLDQLIDELQNGSVIPFIGAGLSIASGMVGWDAIVSKIAADLKQRGFADVPEQLLPGGRYHLDLAEFYNLAHRNVYLLNRTLKAYFDGDFSPNELHDIVLRFNFDIIITTNFDRLIEKAMDRRKMSFNLVTEDEHLEYFDEKVKTQLVKMHGTIENPESAVFSLRSYNEYAARRSLLYSFLTGVFTTKTILFVGFSLRDPNVESLLRRVKGEKRDSFRDHYALLVEPDQPTIGRLSELGIRCIRAVGADVKQATKAALLRIYERGAATANRNLDRAVMINRTFESMLDTLPTGAIVRMRASLGMTSNPAVKLTGSFIYGADEQDDQEIKMGDLLRRFLRKSAENRYRGIVHVNSGQQLSKGFGRQAFRARLEAMIGFLQEFEDQIELAHSPVPTWMNHLILHDRASFLSHKGSSLAGYEKTRRTHIRSMVMSEINTFDSDFESIVEDNIQFARDFGIDVEIDKWLTELSLVIASQNLAELDRVREVLCCDNDGNITGAESRDTVHASGQLHRSVHLHLLDGSAPGMRVLLQRRGPAKDLYPGMVDAAVAGHQETESAAQDALREASEELGIWISEADLHHLFEYKRRITNDSEYISVFAADLGASADAIARRYAEEIQELYWVELADLEKGPHIPARGFKRMSSVVFEVETVIHREEIIEGTVEEIVRLAKVISARGLR
jgi:isopentenyldiphosphate isomerase